VEVELKINQQVPNIFLTYALENEVRVEMLARRLYDDARLTFWFSPWHKAYRCCSGCIWRSGASSASPTGADEPSTGAGGTVYWVSHPMYTALLVLYIAYFMRAANLLIGLLDIGVMVVVMAVRTREKEALMLAIFGDQYRAYMRRHSPGASVHQRRRAGVAHQHSRRVGSARRSGEYSLLPTLLGLRTCPPADGVCACAGRDVPFMRPECTVPPQLQCYCPEIIGDSIRFLAGRARPIPKM
jgi:hypothetical protein